MYHFLLSTLLLACAHWCIDAKIYDLTHRMQCAEYFDHDMPGNTYYTLGDHTFDECCGLCEDFAGCVAWTWKPDTSTANKIGICEIKNALNPIVNVTSSQEFVTGFYGMSTTPKATTSTTPEMCQEQEGYTIFGYVALTVDNRKRSECCDICYGWQEPAFDVNFKDAKPCVGWTWKPNDPNLTGDEDVGVCELKHTLADLLPAVKDGNVTGIIYLGGSTAFNTGTTPPPTTTAASTSEETSSEEDCWSTVEP